MQLLFACIAVAWWIAIWGLVELYIESWTREEKKRFYIALLVAVVLIIILYPKAMQRI